MKKSLKKSPRRPFRYEKHGVIRREDLGKLPFEQRHMYLLEEFNKKYKTQVTEFRCESCITETVYKDSGYITDEELIEITHFKHA